MHSRSPLVLQIVAIAAIVSALIADGSQIDVLRAQEVATGVTFDKLACTLPFPRQRTQRRRH